MKAFLMHRARDFDLEQPLPTNAAELTRDLGLATLFDAMARGDDFLYRVAQTAVLSILHDPAEMAYRQDVLRDCLEHPDVITQIYDIAVEVIGDEKKVYRGFLSNSPNATLGRSVEVLQLFVGTLRRLRSIAEEQVSEFRSEGLSTFFEMLIGELFEDYFAVIEEHLRRLEFRDGVLVSAELGAGCKGRNYILRKPWKAKRSWLELMSLNSRSPYTLTISDRDEAGARALSELRDTGVNLVANALAQSTDHILNFFTMLRREVGFYVSALNLHEQLAGKGEPLCFPLPLDGGTPQLSCRGLYDVCLSLRRDGRAVGNDVDADDKTLVMITGANQGGKSTFLRSVGLAQLMMQCGMFVGAESLRASTCDGLFTHYKREEDTTMSSGKLDEELQRMSEIADSVTPNSVVLFNESFAATNEREGSQIAREVVGALVESGIRVFFVTHLFDLAHGFYRQHADAAIFLRAERQPDMHRTFKLVEGEPLPTSYGQDLYDRIFGVRGAPSPR